MMKYTNTEGFTDESSFDGDRSAFPKMRPCSTATTISHRRAERRAERAAVISRRVSFDHSSYHHRVISDSSNNNTVKTPPSPGGETTSYISLGDNENSDDETIYSSSLYSMHNYSPAAMKEKKKEEKATAPKSLFCPSSITLEDILEEVEGTFEDTVKSFKQVLNAFVISPEDIDCMANEINDAREEIMELELERRWAAVRNLEAQL